MPRLPRGEHRLLDAGERYAFLASAAEMARRMRIIKRVGKNRLIVACARCGETGRYFPANPMSSLCEVCGGRAELLVRVENDIFKDCPPCEGSGRSYPANPMSSPCQQCKGVGGLTITGAVGILPWAELLAEPLAPGAFHTILFTDVEGSTALTQRLGDAKARDALRAHERIVREALKSHGGSEVKALGDGFMASFPSATHALECAIAMQKVFAEHNQTAGEPIRVRIGLNAGEPIAEAEDLFGTAVNLAARIAAQAAGGEILVANVVRELAAGKGFAFADRGSVTLRGFEDPVRLYEVRWQG